MRTLRVLAWVAVLLCLLLVGVVLALHRWAGSEDFRQRLVTEASAALGVPVHLDSVGVTLWPLPALALQGLVVEAKPALSLQRIEARPVLSSLLRGELRVATLTVREAVLPQTTVALLGARLNDPARAEAETPSDTPTHWRWVPREVVLDGITWIGASGRETSVDARLSMADDAWPERMQVQVVGGALKGASASLQREGQATAWQLQLRVGGGTVQGPVSVQLPEKPGGELQLKGEMRTEGVEVAALTAPKRVLTGRLQASTTLSASVDPSAKASALTDAVRSRTQFQITGATVHGLDLIKAVSTVGLSRGGQTELDTLAGQVRTRGQTIELSNLVATSGALAATGDVTVSPSGALSGRVRVDLTRGASGGLVGVPLVVGGTLDEPSVTLTRAALVGAAIGTAVMPGVGTGAGANLGDRIGEGLKGLFGGDKR
jgi:hypothetical protein